MRYGMVIDLRRCTGCRACTIACKAENGTGPGVFWREVIMYESGTFPRVRREYIPRGCMHCKDGMCVKVCPTGASQQRPDGIVWVDDTVCIGCRYCVEACPYDARFYRYQEEHYFPQGLTPWEKYHYPRQETGVVQKCNFCMHRVDQGCQPACVETCLGGACFFGDLDDPDSEISQLIASRKGYQLLAELGTDPSVYYLAQ